MPSGEDYPFPVEFEIRNDELGAPFAIGQGCSEVSLSIAHKERHAVAIASKDRNVGIDIELIEKREPSFYKAAFTESELAMAPKTNRDVWATGFGVQKKPTLKRLAGV